MSLERTRKVVSSQASSRHDLATALEANDHLRQIVEARLREHQEWQVERTQWSEERRLLRAMIDQVPDYLFVKDTQSRFVIANKAVATDLGFGPNDILGKTDLELHPYELARQFLETERAVLSTGEPVIDNEEYVVLPSGEKRWLLTSKLPLRNEAGAIIGLVGVSRDVTRRKLAEDQVRQLAYNDQLTGLPNRLQFEELLDAAPTERRPASLLLVDLDRFKQVNDTLGHGAGDMLLRLVGVRLGEVVAGHGIVARLGGDEFGLLVEAGPSLSAICDAIVAQIGLPFEIEGKSVRVGASIGVAHIESGSSAMESLRQADIALYQAKALGRGRWLAFATEMAMSLERRHRLEEELRAALQSPDEIFAMFQPVYSVDRRRMVGAEALARWLHPKAGLMLPGEFIPLAEEAGLIEALGDRIVEQACAVLARSRLPWVSVNISSLQLRMPDFVSRLLGRVRAAGIEPSRLQLEITESVLLEENRETRAVVEALRASGFQTALDDFGTGYSSLNYLRRFQIDKLKVDRSFVAEIGTRSANAIVEAIVSLARGLDMTVTAEGVETEPQRLFLARIGCHEIQGYLTSPPVTEARLNEMLPASSGS